MHMKKKLLSINAIAVSAALLLTACDGTTSSIDMEKIQRIGDNCTTIYNNVAEIDTEELTENVQQTAETATEIGEWYEEEIVEGIVADSMAAAEEAANYDDIALEDINIFDVLDEQAVAEIILEPVIAQVNTYTEEIDLMFEEADKMKEIGLEKILQGIEMLSKLKDVTEVNDKVIAQMIEGLTLLVNGSNDITEGANIIVQESARTANEILAQAEMLGVEGEEMDMLKQTLQNAQEIQLYAFSEDVVEQLEVSKELIDQYAEIMSKGEGLEVDVEIAVDMDQIEAQLEAIPGYVEAVKELIGSANDAAKYTQDLYKEIDAGSRVVVDKAREIFEGENLEIAETAIKSYELVGAYIESIPTKQIDDIEKGLDQVVKFSKSVDYKAIINGFFK